MIYAILIFKTEGFENKYAYAFIIFGIMVLGYIIVSQFYLGDVRVYPGDLFSRRKVMESYRDIMMLNFFDNVIPDIIPINDKEVDIQLEVSEKSTGQANFSMGYNGGYGFTGGGGFEFPNFRGRGQTLSISYQRGLNNNSNLSGHIIYMATLFYNYV